MSVFLFDPYQEGKRKVSDEDLYHEIFVNHCRPVKDEDNGVIAHRVWKWLCRDMTKCRRPSFIQWLPHTKPYFDRSELMSLAENAKTSSTCPAIQGIEFTSEELCSHMDHIQQSGFGALVKNYTLLDSSQLNSALRCGEVSDSVVAYKIQSLTRLILETPALKKSRVVYRFVDNDSYLQGRLHITDSYWSCTRNPLYDPKKHHFGYIVFQIEIPAGIKGVGLLLEGFSLFPEEQEFLLPPGTELEVVKETNSYRFSHPDQEAQERVVRFIRMKVRGVKKPRHFSPERREQSSWQDFAASKGFEEVVVWLSETRAVYRQTFPTSIPIYSKFFITQKGTAAVLWDMKALSALHVVEIDDDVMHANYFRRYCPSKKRYDNLLIKFLSVLGNKLSIWSAVIHPHFRECGPHDTRSYNQDIVRLYLRKHRRFSGIPEVTRSSTESKPNIGLVKRYRELALSDPASASIIAEKHGFHRAPTYHFDVRSYLLRTQPSFFLSDEEQ